MKIHALLLFLSGVVSHGAAAQQEIPLYSGTIPNSTGHTMKASGLALEGKTFVYYTVDTPSLKVYLPHGTQKKNIAIIIIPGGGYGALYYASEGTDIAEAFQKNGIACFILKYRLPNDATMKDKSIGPLQDAQQAIKIIRTNAVKWNLDTAKIGVIGYSAGGHLASSLGTHYSKSYIDNPDSISLRPDFMILVYPVISMKKGLAHMGSRYKLLGLNPSDEQVRLFSNEEQVDVNTPPTYLTHTADDSTVSVENSIAFYRALVKNRINVEMHLYPKGNHGFTQGLPLNEWLDPMLHWLKKLRY